MFFEKIKKIKRQAFGRSEVVSSTNLFSQGLLNLWDMGWFRTVNNSKKKIGFFKILKIKLFIFKINNIFRKNFIAKNFIALVFFKDFFF